MAKNKPRQRRVKTGQVWENLAGKRYSPMCATLKGYWHVRWQQDNSMEHIPERYILADTFISDEKGSLPRPSIIVKAGQVWREKRGRCGLYTIIGKSWQTTESPPMNLRPGAEAPWVIEWARGGGLARMEADEIRRGVLEQV